MKHFIAIIALFALCACAAEQKIDANPNPVAAVVAALPQSEQDKAKADLLATAANFDAAASIGIGNSALYASCAHDVNKQLGVEAVASAPQFPSVTLENKGIISGASMLIINAEKLAMVKDQGIVIPENCAAAWGVLNIKQLSNLLIGPVKVTIGPSLLGAAKP